MPNDIINAFIIHTNIDNKYSELFNELSKVDHIYEIKEGMFGWLDYSNLSQFQCTLWDMWAIIQKYKSK